MNIEELLRPRYKVIAGYPDSHYTIGTILDRNWCRYENDDEETGKIIWQISDFPDLFKKLEWYEERKPEDMPEYIKFTNSGRVFKISKWSKCIGGWNMNNEIDGKDVTDGYASIEWHFYKEKSAPATLAEYEQYINQKEKQ